MVKVKVHVGVRPAVVVVKMRVSLQGMSVGVLVSNKSKSAYLLVVFEFELF